MSPKIRPQRPKAHPPAGEVGRFQLATDADVAPGLGEQSSENSQAGRFLFALGETGTGGGNAGGRGPI